MSAYRQFVKEHIHEFDHLPKQLHNGLKATLNNQLIRVKIETILELERANNTKI